MRIFRSKRDIDLIRQNEQRSLNTLEQELIRGAKGHQIEVSLAEIRKKGLIATLRARTAPQRQKE
jgi:hypothetical protein